MIKLLILAVYFLNPQVQYDSVGIETINGKVFIIHKVEEKETLYGISKRYGSTVEAILQVNPNAGSGLEIGQLIKVPYTATSRTTTTTRTQSSGGIIHVVGDKETLFSISKAYNVSIDDIKQWNNLTSNSLSVGQEIVVKKKTSVSTNPKPSDTTTPQPTSKRGTHTVSAKETMFSISKQYGISIQQLKDWNNLQSNELSIGQVLYLSDTGKNVPVVSESKPTTPQPPVVITKQPEQPPVQEVKPPQKETITISESVKGSDEVLESGLAELIEGTDGNRKYLALHRTAPVGTILKVRNEMNNREVFVRVMGKLPDTSLTDKLIIRISKSAYDRLGAIDQRFRVQLTYYK
jgi:LysM repeat protein